MTFRDRLIAGLEEIGWRRDVRDRSKYAAYVKDGYDYKLFVGTAGALRRGECASRSYSIGDPGNQTSIYQHLLKQGDKRYAPRKATPAPWAEAAALALSDEQLQAILARRGVAVA